MKNKDTLDKSIEKYNYLKSIKDKENIILSYYKKISHLNSKKPTPLPKPKSKTKKNTYKTELKDNINEDKNEDTKEANTINLIDKKNKEKEKEKKTKKQIVIMDD
jgi:hypothetical protein